MLYNPLDFSVHKQIEINLYYTGLKDQAQVSCEDGDFSTMPIDAYGKALLEITIPANKWTWYVFK